MHRVAIALYKGHRFPAQIISHWVWVYYRFNYEYSTEDLNELKPKIVEVSEQAEVAQVLFNNNYEDQGQRNAAELVKLLDGKG